MTDPNVVLAGGANHLQPREEARLMGLGWLLSGLFLLYSFINIVGQRLLH